MVLDTVHLDAGQTALLASEATTFVTAWVHLIAAFIHELYASGLPTDILKCVILAD